MANGRTIELQTFAFIVRFTLTSTPLAVAGNTLEFSSSTVLVSAGSPTVKEKGMSSKRDAVLFSVVNSMADIFPAKELPIATSSFAWTYTLKTVPLCPNSWPVNDNAANRYLFSEILLPDTVWSVEKPFSQMGVPASFNSSDKPSTSSISSWYPLNLFSKSQLISIAALLPEGITTSLTDKMLSAHTLPIVISSVKIIILIN